MFAVSVHDFTRATGVEVPLLCGPMYPCSNPELVAAVSKAGGLGIVQPLSLTYVHGHPLRDGLRLIKRLSDGAPVGMNALIESSSKSYHDRMVEYVDIAMEEGIRFFLTSLGKPGWVVDRVSQVGGIVFHDVTERRWALKGIDEGVHGLVAVNRRAGGHTGRQSAEQLMDELGDLGVPLVCAGGISTPQEFAHALRLGYRAVQMGTRFIATEECRVSDAYKRAIIDANEDDIVLSERITGVPLALIRTAYVERTGLHAGPFARWMLRGRRRKRLMRTFYAIRAGQRMKRASLDERAGRALWQAGRSVAGIEEILPAGEIVRQCAAVLETA